MAIPDSVKIYLLYFRFIIWYAPLLLYQKVLGLRHKRTYKSVQEAQNVVVIGGSFAGVQLAKRLSNSLPTGYKVVLIERCSHFNYSFNFPRYSVLKGHERNAFIPYDGMVRQAPNGMLRLIQGTVTHVTAAHVHIGSGDQIRYAYLAIATGSWQPSPARLRSIDRKEACSELQDMQKSISQAQKIAVIGGGAVGVEVAADIKSYYPQKDVTLVHSREQLLPRFGQKLHDHVMETYNALGIRTILQSRPQLVDRGAERCGTQTLRFADGHIEEYDLVVSCTGQQPRSSVVKDLIPGSISSETGRILVRPTLQVLTSAKDFSHIFALGDVAETMGPKMARAAFFQADIVNDNILSLIKGSNPGKTYRPKTEIEGAIKLTIGKTHWVLYTRYASGTDMLMQGEKANDDLDIGRAWKMYGAKLEDACAPERE